MTNSNLKIKNAAHVQQIKFFKTSHTIFEFELNNVNFLSKFDLQSFALSL